MKTYLLVGALAALNLWAVLPAQETGPKETFTYRLTEVTGVSTLQEKVNEVASGGYRLAGTVADSSKKVTAILEKSSLSHGAYHYLLLTGKSNKVLQNQLNEAGAKSFQLAPRSDLFDWSLKEPAMAWMERAPEPGKKSEYFLISFDAKRMWKEDFNPKVFLNPRYMVLVNPFNMVEDDVFRARALGYRLVYIVPGHAIVMEKADRIINDRLPAGAQPSSGKKTNLVYTSLKNLKGPSLLEQLRNHASHGYCIIDITPHPIPFWTAIVMENNEISPAAGRLTHCEYDVLQEWDLTEGALNNLGQRGFRLVPQSINSSRFERKTAGRRFIADAIVEKRAALAFEYRVFSASEVPAISQKLDDAGAEGYHLAKVTRLGDEIVAVMEKSSVDSK